MSLSKLGRIGREFLLLAFFLGLILAALPLLIVLSVAMFQSLQDGWASAMAFLTALGEGLATGSVGSWTILLGPYALFSFIRGVSGGWKMYREKTRVRRVERAH